MEDRKKTLVLGASTSPERYSNMAVRKLMKAGHPVVAVGSKAGTIDGCAIHTGEYPIENIDTLTLYVGPKHQPELYAYVLSLNPKRIIFNPGTENPELEAMAREKGMEVVHACTLTLLAIDRY